MAYELLFENKELLKVVYALSLSFICAIIVLKSDRLFKLSDYQGLRYFRNAFFCYGLSFVFRFIIGGTLASSTSSNQFLALINNFSFEFFLIMAGFFLLYSLTWKRIEGVKNYHSFFNVRVGIFCILAILITTLDFIFNTRYLMYLSQIFLFLVMAIIGFRKYTLGGKSHKFLKYYFLTIVLGLIAWILNLIPYYFVNWTRIIQLNIYSINIIFFLIFLYITARITNGKNG